MVDRTSWNAIKGMIRKLRQRLAMMVTRARITSSTVGANGQTATVDMLQGIQRDGAEVFEPYGVSSFLPPGAEAVALAVGGSGDQVAVLGAAPRGGVPEGKLPGEVDFYSAHGQVIRCHVDGSISISPGSVLGVPGTVYTGSAVDPLLPYTAAGGDSVIPSAQLIAWMTAASALLNVPPGAFPLPIPTSIGTIAPVITRKTKVG